MPPVVTFVGLSNSGKTTLIEKLLPEIKRRGYRIGTVKHTHHGVEMDQEGKDTWRHRAAGAEAVVLVGQDRVAMIRSQPSAALDSVLPLLRDLDLVMVEGFKTEAYPKIEILRAVQGRRPLFLGNPDLVALVTDVDLTPEETLAAPHTFGLEDIVPLADLVQRRFLDG